MGDRTGDLLIKGGRLIDPSSGLHGDELDILIENGRITAVGKDLNSPDGIRTVELEGEYVAPGFIDIHTHVFDVEGTLGGYRLGLPADMIGVTQGVTTVIDAGTAGPATMDVFRKESVDRSRTRVLSAMHYATDGLKDPPEADDPSKYDLKTGIDAYEKNRDIVVAIKARASNSCVGQLGITSIAAGKELARAVGLPLLVHIGHMPPRIEEVADLMDKGDIITHAFHGKDNNLLDIENRRIPEFTERARQRGVVFDIGHGKDSFNINTGKLARELGFYPDTISTDLHTSSFHKPVKSLPETMSKFMALGYTLEEVVDKVTSKPAEYLSLEGLGSIREGYTGDITVFRIEKGEYTFTDANRNTVSGDSMIVPVCAVVGGSVEMDSECEFRKLYRAIGADPDYMGETEYMAGASLRYLEERGVKMEGERLSPFLNHLIAMMGRLRDDEHLDGMDDLLDQMDPGALEITDGMMKLFERWYPSPDAAERVLVAIHVQTAMGIGV
ncbi:MAG: amidohydrolase/deacetylase family metallohydrolase [Oscillospiraceae bacterium]|nr:amidohydrolase/deacetylase family metallohydrolase [Oscillospiraceae bacterium]